jgi:intein/homing endonuclease
MSIASRTIRLTTEGNQVEQLLCNEAFYELLEKLIIIGKGANYGQIVFMAGGGGCFDGDTLVKCEHGLKKIKDIVEGDKVWSHNIETNQQELKEVDKTFKYDEHHEDILELTLSTGKTIICTENHEFYINGAWIKAKDL